MEEDCTDIFHDVVIRENLVNFYKTESLCDVTLVTDVKQIRAHQVVLSAASIYFRTHFSTDVGSAGDKNIIKFLEYDSQSVESVIDFIYTGQIHLSLSNIFELMDIEELLQVRNLRSLLSNYLCIALDKNICWQVINKAEYYGYYSLYDTAFLYVIQNFKNLIKERGFLKISYDLLIKCLESPVLNIPTEDVLLCNLVAWVVHDYECRKDYLQELLNRLTPNQILSLDNAVSMVTRLCSNEPSALSVVEPWLEQAQLTRNTYQPLKRLRREIVQDALFAVGGHGTTGSCITSMELNLNLPVTPWKLLLPLYSGKNNHEDDQELPPLITPRHSHAHATNLFSFYILGGENEEHTLSSVEKYDVITNSWSKYPDLPVPITRGASTYLDSCLYISGGISDSNSNRPYKDLWMLREGCKKWVKMCPMNEARFDHGLVAVAGALYAIAGQGENNKLLKSVERYDPNTDSWFYVTSLYHPRKLFCSTVIENTIFIVGGQLETDSIEYNERYDVKTNVWRKWKMFKSSRCVFGASLGRKVVVVSQSSGHAVHTYNTISETKYDGGPPLNHVRIRGSLISIKLPLFRLLPI